MTATFFGDYVGTIKESGLRWVNPLYNKAKISLRARNLNGQTLKVNDKMGNPVEIAAVVVWQVKDTARALFEVDNYVNFRADSVRSGRTEVSQLVCVRSHGRRNVICNTAR